MVNQLTSMLPTDGIHRIWTDSGTKELDEHYPPLHLMAAEVMRSKGYSEPELLVAISTPTPVITRATGLEGWQML